MQRRFYLKVMRVVAMCLMVAGTTIGVAKAQDTGTQIGVDDGGPDMRSVRIRMGPFYMNPRLELGNIGVDTNVFNEPDSQNPKEDFTFTLTPSIDVWMRAGRSWTKFTVSEDLVWYQKYSDQRSANEHYSLTFRLPLNRLAFSFSPSYVSTNARPGFEIDERVHHVDWGGTGTVEIRALSKTLFGVTGTYMNYSYDPNALYNGTDLASQLDRTETALGITVAHELTPLTRLSFNAGEEQARFQHSPFRNSDSTVAGVTASFDPHALLKGSATFGYRDFRPADPSLQKFSGFTAQGDLTYTLLGATRFQVQFKRDVEYSYQVDSPYYVQSGINGSIAQQIFGPVDAVVRGGFANLAYSDLAGTTVQYVNRVDHNYTYGGGLGYHFSNGLRVGFNVDYSERITPDPLMQYHGLRYGASATYDF